MYNTHVKALLSSSGDNTVKTGIFLEIRKFWTIWSHVQEKYNLTGNLLQIIICPHIRIHPHATGLARGCTDTPADFLLLLFYHYLNTDHSILELNIKTVFAHLRSNYKKDSEDVHTYVGTVCQIISYPFQCTQTCNMNILLDISLNYFFFTL